MAKKGSSSGKSSGMGSGNMKNHPMMTGKHMMTPADMKKMMGKGGKGMMGK